MSFSIRKANVCDCLLINQLAGEIWVPTYKDTHSLEQLDYMFEWMYSLPSLEEQMKSGHVFYIAYEKETPLGYMSIEKKDENHYHLQKIYILPTQQGQGLGRFMIGKASEFIRKEQPEKEDISLSLNVNRNNKARFFYEKLGFVIKSEGDFDIGNGYYMNDYLMVKKI